jgi:hypothetical protein
LDPLIPAVYSYPDGSRYVGEFRDNKRSGQGTLTFANGNQYVGEWSDGKENGQGTYTFAGGGKYVGDWRVTAKEMGGALKRTLMGVATLGNGGTIKKMDEAGKPRSRGPTDRNMLVNSRMIPNGQGAYSFPGGANYVGQIKDGFYDGQGTYTSAEGWTQSGLWNRGKFVKADSASGANTH